jgi:hypothetical protein
MMAETPMGRNSSRKGPTALVSWKITQLVLLAVPRDNLFQGTAEELIELPFNS